MASLVALVAAACCCPSLLSASRSLFSTADRRIAELQQWIAHGGCHNNIVEGCHRIWRRTVLWLHRLLVRVCMGSVAYFWVWGGRISI